MKLNTTSSKIRYSGASDELKISRYLSTASKLKNESIKLSKKYTFESNIDYVKNGEIFYSTKHIHHAYVNSTEEFIKLLNVTNRHTKKGHIKKISETEFEYTETLNTGLVVKENTKITGIE